MKDKVIIVEMLVDKIEQYAKTSGELYKLKAIDKGTDVFTSIVSRMVIVSIIALFFFRFFIVSIIIFIFRLGDTLDTNTSFVLTSLISKLFT